MNEIVRFVDENDSGCWINPKDSSAYEPVNNDGGDVNNDGVVDIDDLIRVILLSANCGGYVNFLVQCLEGSLPFLPNYGIGCGWNTMIQKVDLDTGEQIGQEFSTGEFCDILRSEIGLPSFLSIQECMEGTCSCGFDLEGESCSYCDDSPTLGNQAGSVATLDLTRYTQSINCQTCERSCEELDSHSEILTKTNICGTWGATGNFQNSETWIEKSCIGTGWDWGSPGYFSTSNSFNAIIDQNSCPPGSCPTVDHPSYQGDFIESSTCDSYTKKEWCGNSYKTTEKIIINQKKNSCDINNFCGDGVVQNPNADGIEEECDHTDNCNQETCQCDEGFENIMGENVCRPLATGCTEFCGGVPSTCGNFYDLHFSNLELRIGSGDDLIPGTPDDNIAGYSGFIHLDGGCSYLDVRSDSPPGGGFTAKQALFITGNTYVSGNFEDFPDLYLNPNSIEDSVVHSCSHTDNIIYLDIGFGDQGDEIHLSFIAPLFYGDLCIPSQYEFISQTHHGEPTDRVVDPGTWELLPAENPWTEELCGNGILDIGEECEPPGVETLECGGPDIGLEGLCLDDCTCVGS